MKKFEFDKKEQMLCVIEIEGKTFKFNPYTLLVKKATEKFIKSQEPLVKKLRSEPDKDVLENLIVQSCYMIKETLNQILGKGAYERIFAGRTMDFYEHQKVIEFLFTEITEFSKQDVPNTLTENTEPQ